VIRKTGIAVCLLLALATIVVGAIGHHLTGNVSGVCPECRETI